LQLIIGLQTCKEKPRQRFAPRMFEKFRLQSLSNKQ